MTLKQTMLGIAIATACAAATAADPGFAVSSRISNVQLGVFDLAPDDGIAAGYAIKEYKGFYEYSFKAASGQVIDYDKGTWSGSDPFSRLSGFGNSSVSFAATSGFAGLATNATIRSDAGADSFGWTDVRGLLTVTLAPHSAVSLSGLVETSAKWDQLYTVDGWGQLAAYVGIDKAGGTSASVGIDHYTQFERGREESWTKDFWFAYANETDAAIDVNLFFGVNASSSLSSVAPVPEPATWGMLGAGLALLGAVAARRQRRTDQS